MELGSIRARAIAKTPNSVSATSPKFQRVRRVDSIEVVRRLIGGIPLYPAPRAQVLRDSSGCKANGKPLQPNTALRHLFQVPARGGHLHTTAVAFVISGEQAVGKSNQG
jgi:hypothetical protein